MVGNINLRSSFSVVAHHDRRTAQQPARTRKLEGRGGTGTEEEVVPVNESL